MELKEVKEKMSKTVDLYHHELATVRTGIASTALVEHLSIDCYGSAMPLLWKTTWMPIWIP